jgi:outer membrane protein OmpA-like peptidoglycan-associated protein
METMKKTLIAFFALFLAIAISAIAQDNNENTDYETEKKAMPINLGIYGGMNFNMHSPSFTHGLAIPNSLVERDVYFDESAMGLGLNIGFIANFPLNDMFVISGRIGYNGVGGDLEKSAIFQNLQGVPDTTVNMLLESSLPYLEISPVLQVHGLIPPVKDLYFLGGFEFGLPISPKYSLTETLVSPDQYEGENGTTRNHLQDESVPDANIRLAAMIGAGYMFQATDNLYITPELSFRYPFDVVSDNYDLVDWKVPQIRFGVSITYGFGTIDDEPEPDEAAFLDIGFDEVRYYDPEGNHYKLESIQVEDIQYSELFPFIPYVFCELESSEPSTTNQVYSADIKAGEFSIEQLDPDAMKINQRTLDVIGSRMQMIKDAELTITGTSDKTDEGENKELALQRAEFAKDYLVNTYEINPMKINIRSRGLPEKPSSSRVPEGTEENRRIEFSSSNPKLFEPIIIKNETQRIANPNLIEFLPYANSSDSVIYWELNVMQAGNELRNFTGTGELPSLSWVIYPNELTDKQIPVEYSLTVKNKSGLEESVNESIPVDYFSTIRKKTEELPDKTISKFSLILFDFDKSNVSDMDMEIIEKEIIPSIKYNSTVKIYGYSDRIGDEEYNKNLAKRRADAVKERLANAIGDARYEVFGVGENEVLFDNDSPIGRQLSRTVQVYVITPR